MAEERGRGRGRRGGFNRRGGYGGYFVPFAPTGAYGVPPMAAAWAQHAGQFVPYGQFMQYGPSGPAGQPGTAPVPIMPQPMETPVAVAPVVHPTAPPSAPPRHRLPNITKEDEADPSEPVGPPLPSIPARHSKPDERKPLAAPLGPAAPPAAAITAEATEATDRKRSTSTKIIEQDIYGLIDTYSGIAKLPTILIITGDKAEQRHHKCVFDKVPANVNVLKINKSFINEPDVPLDFDDALARKRFFHELQSTGVPVIAILFTRRTFKEMHRIPDLFSDAKNILVHGGKLIFEFELFGGGIIHTFYNEPTTIEGLNQIRIFNPSTDLTPLIKRSQENILTTLISIFGHAEMHTEQPYPFMESTEKTIFLVARKDLV
ncbi:MAG: hypothetical protein Hyperionvirus7_32 [Hyperionvirus sp.]|uniref:Uncharacterized protein n=1 Tax=Hyperionvirus sp. TaxID=2487770 RepID=A0A3G5AB49_9VIRU|nr:MAG: hypothetical protein Hyperionvirus7_32 [Hyperionvirus sp.]